MSRFQLSLNVDDVDAAVEFYRKLFGVEPAKHRPGYANFSIENPPLKLVVIEGEGTPGSINHVGVEHPSAELVAAETTRLEEIGLPVEADESHTCCFATQEKAWTRDADGVPWEIYTVVDDTEHFGASPRGGTPVDFVLPPVDLDELAAALDDPEVAVVDAQGIGGFQAGHIPGAHNIEIDDVLGQAAVLLPDRGQRIVLYCTDQDCLGSEFVGTQLVEAGYTNVGRFPGGLGEWVANGGAVVTGDQTPA